MWLLESARNFGTFWPTVFLLWFGLTGAVLAAIDLLGLGSGGRGN